MKYPKGSKIPIVNYNGKDYDLRKCENGNDIINVFGNETWNEIQKGKEGH